MSRLDGFLFAPIDPASVAVFRILLAAMLVLAFWPTELPPLGRVAEMPWAAATLDSVFRTPAWWGAAMVAVAALALGVGGRAAPALAVLLLLPLLPVHGRESRQVLLLTLLAFALLHSDRRLGWRPRAASSADPIWPMRLVQIQLSALYAVNAWAKLTPEFLGGDVLVELSQVMPNFRVDLSGGSLPIGPLSVPVWLCAVGTVAIEAALAVAFWIPGLRLAAAALGVGFHLGTRLVLTVGWLDATTVFLYLSFVLPFEREGGSQGAHDGS